jgi:hypothetical protein
MAKNKAHAGDQQGHAPAPQGDDNNTRLAFLESRVEPLITATTKIVERYGGNVEIAPNSNEDLIDCQIRILNTVADLPDVQLDRIEKIATAVAEYGIDLGEGLDPVEQAIAIIGRAREIMLGLAEAFVEGGHDLDPGEDVFAGVCRVLKAAADSDATSGEIAAIARAEAAEKALAGAQEQIAQLEQAIDQIGDEGKRPGFLKRLLSRGGAGGDPEAPASREPVECGPTYGSASVEEIRGFLAEEHLIEVVLSDGSQELVESQPTVLVRGDLVRRGHNYLLNRPILLVGPEGGREIAGAALLVDGVQADFCAFDRPMQIAPGEQYQFSHQFTFGN